jgi:hypothetical protein
MKTNVVVQQKTKINKGYCPTEDKGYCPTEDKGYCPTKDKGYCPTEDKGYHKVSHSHQNQSHPIPI